VTTKTSSAAEITFGPFRLDVERRLLFRDGAPVPLRSRGADILCALVAASGKVVTKEELMAEVWPRLNVGDNTVQVHVSALRKALGEDVGGQRFIVTIPGRGYRFIAGPTDGSASSTPGASGTSALTLPDKPSIAVMPFENMSGDREQDYFADGIAEDIITALSRIRWLFVIARNSTFTYKGRNVDLKQAGRDLGVRYVLEGSVRKAGNRVRITGQLVDASTGAHLWADSFDGDLVDVFELQDRVTVSVVSAISPTLEKAEIERAKRKPTESLTAYDYFLRAMACMYQWTREGNDEALRLFERAREIDPAFACAYAVAAACYCPRMANGWISDLEREKAEAAELARRGARLGPSDAVALASAAHALSYVVHDLDTAAGFVERALTLDPNLAAAWEYSGAIRAWLSDPDTAIERLTRALRLSPLDPLLPRRLNIIGFAHFIAGRYDEALSWGMRALRDQPDFLAALRLVAATSACVGRMDEARAAVARHMKLDPAMRVSKLRQYNPTRQPADFARFAGALRKAGMPE
jgi:TolB-like protein/tetratricopeptide (TPR) repeat protein